jgi:hypothetical protein
VPAVVTFPASVNNYQLSIEQASKNFWVIELHFLGGWLPKSPIPLTGKKPNPSHKQKIKKKIFKKN